MKVAIGIWWAIVQHKRLLILILVKNLLIMIIILPFFKNAWLLDRQIATHFKASIWHMQSLFVIHFPLLKK